jgi:hypothetical protein
MSLAVWQRQGRRKLSLRGRQRSSARESQA